MPQVKRVGRPRATGQAVSGDPRMDILRHAAALIAKQGFAATSTRQIAMAAGLRQPSLFHYFPKKDDLLQALTEEAYGLSLSRIQKFAGDKRPAPARLKEAIETEINEADSFAINLHALTRSPEVRNLDTAKALRQKLFRAWRKLISEGQSEGKFRSGDPVTYVRMVTGLIELAFETDLSKAKRKQLAIDTAEFVVNGLKAGRKK